MSWSTLSGTSTSGPPVRPELARLLEQAGASPRRASLLTGISADRLILARNSPPTVVVDKHIVASSMFASELKKILVASGYINCQACGTWSCIEDFQRTVLFNKRTCKTCRANLKIRRTLR
jgi:hypothetical protein